MSSRSCSCHHYFTDTLRNSGCAMPDEPGWNLPAVSEAAENLSGKAAADRSDRSSCRTAGRCVLYFQRIDPVLRQFLRFHCNGRKHGGIQSGRVRLYVNERCLSDCFKFYQPEYGGRQIRANRYDSSALRGSRNHHWTGSRRTCCSVSSASAQHLFH